MFTNKHYKQLNINYLKRVKVNINKINITLDNRFFDIQQSSGQFNQFIRVTLPWFKESKRRAETINLPIKYHKHSLKIQKLGFTRCNSVQLQLKNNKYFLNLYWQKETAKQQNNYAKVGVDQGYNKLISDSNGVHWGKELKQIYLKLARKQRGSKNYQQTLIYKKNKINEVVNKFLATYSCTDIICQNLKDVKKHSKFYKDINNKLQYWSYRQVLDKLEHQSQLKGFKIIKVEPAYTSQTCSFCGTIIKSNRDGQTYTCCNCGKILDADTNAAVNILRRGIYSSSSLKTNNYNELH